MDRRRRDASQGLPRSVRAAAVPTHLCILGLAPALVSSTYAGERHSREMDSVAHVIVAQRGHGAVWREKLCSTNWDFVVGISSILKSPQHSFHWLFFWILLEQIVDFQFVYLCAREDFQHSVKSKTILKTILPESFLSAFCLVMCTFRIR